MSFVQGIIRSQDLSEGSFIGYMTGKRREPYSMAHCTRGITCIVNVYGEFYCINIAIINRSNYLSFVLTLT